MNKIHKALTLKLQWKLQALHQQIHHLNDEIFAIEKSLKNLELPLEASCKPTRILPEQETARFYFHLREHQKKLSLNAHKSALQAEKLELESKETRLKTELKMIEKQAEAQLKLKRLQQIIIEQNVSDEWIIQGRDGL